MAKASIQDTTTKIIREYRDDDGKLSSRWYYDYAKFKNGPVLVEEFNIPPKEKKQRVKKVG